MPENGSAKSRTPVRSAAAKTAGIAAVAGSLLTFSATTATSATTDPTA